MEEEKVNPKDQSKTDPPKEECKHNWVMDGHNAGDPICSKCLKQE